MRLIVKEKFLSDKIVYFLLVVAYRLLLDIAYSGFVYPEFAYMGFICHASVKTHALSWVLLLLYLIFNYSCFRSGGRLSCEIMFLLFLLSIVPSTTATAYGLISLSVTLWNTVFWIVCYGCLIVFSHFKEPVSLELTDTYADLNDKLMLTAAIVFGVVIFYISWKFTGFRLNFDLSVVYELRDEARGYSINRIASYLYSWSQVCLPIVMAYFFVKRKWLFGALCFVLLLLAFGIDGSKFVFFLAVVSAVVSNLRLSSIEKLNRWILLGVIAVVAGGLVLFFKFHSISVLSYFVRRTMFIPLRLEQCYFEFFSEHTPDYFRGSFLRHFGFSTPYPNMAQMIGELYFHSQDTNANCGLAANAVANLGVYGCLIMPVLMSFVFHLMDESAKGIDARIYISTAVYAAQSLINSAFFTVLLTHGMLMVILLLFFMKKRNTETLFARRENPNPGK